MNNIRVVFKGDSINGDIQLFSEGKIAGKMEISVEDGKLRVFHTEVNPEHAGRGFAKQLLNRLVGYARENNLKIIPRCPYVLAQFKSRPEEYADVWLKRA